MRENRKSLLPCLKAAKKDPHVKRCSLVGDILWIDGSKYTVSNMDDIPQKFWQAKKGQRYFSKCDSTLFFGRGSFLSNHHSSQFKEEGIMYSCSEQYYLQKKSLFFNDDSTASAIMKADDPGKMKAIARKIKGLDESKWQDSARSVMEKACFLKFTKNLKTKSLLTSTKGILVEANEKDSYFSCGLSLSDPHIMERSRWAGKNILGDILTELRDRLKQK